MQERTRRKEKKSRRVGDIYQACHVGRVRATPNTTLPPPGAVAFGGTIQFAVAVIECSALGNTMFDVGHTQWELV